MRSEKSVAGLGRCIEGGEAMAAQSVPTNVPGPEVRCKTSTVISLLADHRHRVARRSRRPAKRTPWARRVRGELEVQMICESVGAHLYVAARAQRR